MPFVYNVATTPTVTAAYTTHSSVTTQDPWMSLRQASRNFNMIALMVAGRGASLTALSGISHRVKRWTTASSDGTALTPAPRRIGTTASTTAADKQTTLTTGSVSGAIQLVVNHGGAGPGGWVARDEDSKITVEAGTADELQIFSMAGVTALAFDGACDIEE